MESASLGSAAFMDAQHPLPSGLNGRAIPEHSPSRQAVSPGGTAAWYLDYPRKQEGIYFLQPRGPREISACAVQARVVQWEVFLL